MLSVFLRDPQFQGQTKDRLYQLMLIRLTEQAVRDRFDHWLSSDTARATYLLKPLLTGLKRESAQKKRKWPDLQRRLRLPGKLADCTSNDSEFTELFLVEGLSWRVGKTGA